MKCNQCSANLSSGVKFCPECGSKQELKCSNCSASLIQGVKFCPECGFKVTAVADAKAAAPTFTISLAPDALELAPCQVSTQEVTGQGPDGDGEISITVKYQVSNPTDEDWEYLVVRSQLVGSSGQVIDESTDTHEQTISAAESSEFETIFWGVKAQLLGENPSGASVVVNVIACVFLQKKLGEIGIPDVALEAVAIPSGELGNVVNLVSGTLWKTEADEEDVSCVEVKLLLQNLTDQHIPKVQLIAEIVDKIDRDLFDAGTSDELLPGNIFLIAGGCSGKEKQFKGAKANLALRAYPAVAAGNCITTGIAMSSAEESDEEIGPHVFQVWKS